MTRWKQEIRRRLAGLKLAPAREAEIIEELAQHLDDRYKDSLARGATHWEIFSVVNGVLLRPLPYPEPDRLVMVNGISFQAAQEKTPLCEADFLDWKSQNQVFESIAGFSSNRFNYTGGESPEQIEGAWVTSDFFSTIGIQPAMGRAFLPGEDLPNTTQTVVLSDGFWRRYLGSSRNVIDQQMTLNARAFTPDGEPVV